MDCNASAMALKVVDAMLESSGLAPALAAASAEAHRHLIGRWYSAATRRMYGIVSHPVEGQTPVLALSVQHQLLGMLKPVEGVLSMSSPAHGTVEVRVPEIGRASCRERGWPTVSMSWVDDTLK